MPVGIRIAGYQDERSVHTRAVRVLMGALAAEAGGRIAVDFEPDIAARGRKVADLLELVAGGEIDLCYFSSSYLAGRVPALGVFDIPFLFEDPRDTRARLEGALGEVIARAVAARTDYVVLALWDNGLRSISNRLRPIRTPADCAGLRIRTLPSAGHHAAFRALGMEPVTIDIRDFVAAVRAGEVDAQENPLTNVVQFALQRFHPFVTLTRHFHGIALVLCNARARAGWPDAVRAALAAAMPAATAAQWRFAAEDEVASRAALAAQGVAIIDPDEAARAAFRQAVAAVRAQGLSAIPRELAALLPR